MSPYLSLAFMMWSNLEKTCLWSCGRYSYFQLETIINRFYFGSKKTPETKMTILY